MATCLSCGESGNVSPENIRRWIESLSNVLLSSTARGRFKTYLADREMDDGLSLVEFWERCEAFLGRAEEGHHRTHRRMEDNSEQDAGFTRTGAADWGQEQTRLLLEEAEQIVQFAEEKIPFDREAIELKEAMQSGEKDKMVIAIKLAKQSAADILENMGFYREFCKFILKEKGLLRTRN